MIIAPPLVLTRPEIDEMISRIRTALDATRDDLAREGLI